MRTDGLVYSGRRSRRTRTEIMEQVVDCKDEESLRTFIEYCKDPVIELNRTSKGPSIVSWWPLQTTWKQSGYNAGYWTEQAEAWYQRRIESLGLGLAHPKSNKVWSKELHQGKGTMKVFMRNAEQMAMDSLNEVIV
ncbi:hypothetical protein BC629DRAFT_1718475 [Irpex lacteus]|nr:hypothetical protein BC629DRAFT_1718475 [Irpex lacteus]